METHISNIRLVDGQAEIQIGNINFTVSRRDSDNRTQCCPIELVMGSLGS
ncbi:MAG: hypothetical protein JRH18_03125 [Deltaproteobacteria bacterium]|nr:hypothetical protein [Deltaproteobacteria bacterium]MBW1960636.1 hypothetical protein [Deltaproteobacteria bacterium]MBW1995810.1 hypothetical protein [Deltaproteobacteria bacterium]MBW2150642.1 hypothetical protein [Deltaproteobacteria bacterium]